MFCVKFEKAAASQEDLNKMWNEKVPGFPVWCFGGTDFRFDETGTAPDGTMESRIAQPFNWNGWHKTDDGCIVNKDETLKITDNRANGEESMSSFCVVTTEAYNKD